MFNNLFSNFKYRMYPAKAAGCVAVIPQSQAQKLDLHIQFIKYIKHEITFHTNYLYIFGTSRHSFWICSLLK